MEGLGPVAQRLGEGGRSDRHHHELLEVHGIVGVLAAVEGVHHRHWQAGGAGAAEIGVRQPRGLRRRPGHGYGYAEDGVGTQLGFGRSTVETQQQGVDLGLLSRVFANQLGRNHVIDIGDGPQHALPAVA